MIRALGAVEWFGNRGAVALAAPTVERPGAGGDALPLVRTTVRIEPGAGGLAGWYRLQVGTPAAIPRSVVITARDRDGRTLSSTARPRGRILTRNLFVAPTITELEIALITAAGDPEVPATIGMRRLGRSEFLLRLLRASPSQNFLRGLAFFRDPGAPFLSCASLSGQLRSRSAEADYRCWIAGEEDAAQRALMAAPPPSPPPAIALLMVIGEADPRHLEAALASVRRQSAAAWQLWIADNASTDASIGSILERAAATDERIRWLRLPRAGGVAEATNAVLACAGAPFVCRLEPDAALAPRAVEILASTLARWPDTAILYSDEDHLDEGGQRFAPVFKPAFSRELLQARNYLDRLTVLSTAAVRAAGGFRPEVEGAHDHDLVLRILETISEDRIRHVPAILCHGRGPAQAAATPAALPPAVAAAGLRVVREHFARQGIDAEVRVHDDAFFRVRFRLAAPPRVSILLPTLGRPELLAPCLRTLFGRTTYPDYEVILIDHDVRDPGGRALIDRHAERPNVRVVPYRGKFNYSAMINAGVAVARGELLCLLNDDTAVISPDWLEEMVGLAVQPGVGCVGAKLLFEDGTIQHCGVTVSRDRSARHVFEGHPDGPPGPLGRLVVPSTFTAVTGACLVVSRADYEAVGGLDAERLRISFNDIDLCLAVARLGRRNLLAPAARLHHYEASSRGYPDTAEQEAVELGEAATLRRRNPSLAEDDPFFPSMWTRFYGG